MKAKNTKAELAACARDAAKWRQLVAKWRKVEELRKLPSRKLLRQTIDQIAAPPPQGPDYGGSRTEFAEIFCINRRAVRGYLANDHGVSRLMRGYLRGLLSGALTPKQVYDLLRD